MEKVEVIVFESKEEKGELLSSHPEIEADFGDYFENALMLYNRDHSPPTSITLKLFIENQMRFEDRMKEKFGEDVFFSFDYRNLFRYFNPVIVEVDKEIVERHEQREEEG